MNETMNSIEIAYNDDSFQMSEDTSGGLTEPESKVEWKKGPLVVIAVYFILWFPNVPLSA